MNFLSIKSSNAITIPNYLIFLLIFLLELNLLYKFTSKFVACVLLPAAVLSTSLAYASGGGGGGSSFPRDLPQPRQVDQLYEQGKQIYKGRGQDAVKIKYCVKQQNGKFKKLKGSTAKPFRDGVSIDFASALFDCADHDRLALSTVANDRVPLVLYYLNKRYRLNLQN